MAGRCRLTVQAFVFCLALGGLANLATASVTYSIGNGGLETFNVSIDGTAINGALAGGIAIQQVLPANPSMPMDYTTVCTDIEGTLYLGSSYEYNTPATPFSGQTGVNPTWGAANAPGNSINTANAAQAIQNAAYLFYNYVQLTGTGLGGTTEEKAALQLAVWSALYDTTTLGTVTGSRFQVSGGSDAGAITLADSWLTALNTQADAGDFGYTGYLLYPSVLNANEPATSEPPQELFIGVAAVPEYSTVIAGALLLLPFGTSALRILRRDRATRT